MHTTNYFRSNVNRRNNPVFFFNDRDADSTMTAWVAACDAARAADGHVSVWRVPGVAGPWDVAQIVGHRSRNAIEEQLVRERAIDRVSGSPATSEVPGLELELAALDEAFVARRGSHLPTGL